VHVVVATCRSPDTAEALAAVAAAHPPGRVRVIAMDVADPASVKRAYTAFTDAGLTRLDLLINNAGIASPTHPVEPLLEIPSSTMTSLYTTNVVGPLLVVQSFWPVLEKTRNATVVNMSSGFGSIAGNAGPMGGGYGAYRCSKAALNMLTKTMSNELRGNGRLFLCVAPGWVNTDMGAAGNRSPHLSVEESVDGVLATVARVCADAQTARDAAAAGDSGSGSKKRKKGDDDDDGEEEEPEQKLCKTYRYDGTTQAW
jgi:NAD(P)-dependent dehydrogenase (short-subunit alcohol dehydrogenase family)